MTKSESVDHKDQNRTLKFIQLLCWLVGRFVVFSVPSTGWSFRDGTHIYCPIAKDVRLGFYTVPTGNRTPGRRVAVHYTTQRQLHLIFLGKMSL